jgi:hypothetical protein
MKARKALDEILDVASKRRALLARIHETEIDPRVDAVRAKVEAALTRAGVRYRFIGGLALNIWRAGRPTFDVDVLVSRRRWRQALAALAPLSINREYTGMAGEPEGGAMLQSHEGPWIEVFPEGISAGEITALRNKDVRKGPHTRVALSLKGNALVGLVNSKLASYLSAPDRLDDLSAVQRLCKAQNLDANFALKLDPSVRKAFLKALPRKQT